MSDKGSLLKTIIVVLVLLLLWSSYKLGKSYAMADKRVHQVGQQSDGPAN